MTPFWETTDNFRTSSQDLKYVLRPICETMFQVIDSSAEIQLRFQSVKNENTLDYLTKKQNKTKQINREKNRLWGALQ